MQITLTSFLKSTWLFPGPIGNMTFSTWSHGHIFVHSALSYRFQFMFRVRIWLQATLSPRAPRGKKWRSSEKIKMEMLQEEAPSKKASKLSFWWTSFQSKCPVFVEERTWIGWWKHNDKSTADFKPVKSSLITYFVHLRPENPQGVLHALYFQHISCTLVFSVILDIKFKNERSKSILLHIAMDIFIVL